MKTSMQNLMSGVATALLISAGAAWAQTDTKAQGQSGAEIQQTTPTQQGGAQVDTDAQTGAEVGTEVQQGETQTGTEAQTEAEAGAEAGAEAEQQTETEAGAEAGAETEQQTDTQQQTQEQTQETNVEVDITAEQETRIEQEIREVDVDPVHVDFDVAIGVSVPGTIVLHPLPIVIIDVVPEFEGFLFFILVDGRIAIVHPETLVIVAVI